MQKVKTSRSRSLRNFSVLSAAAIAGLLANRSAHAATETTLTWAPVGISPNTAGGIQEGVWSTGAAISSGTTANEWLPGPTAWPTATAGTTAVFGANGAYVTSDSAGISVDEILANVNYVTINGTNAITLSNGTATGGLDATITTNSALGGLFINAPLTSTNTVSFVASAFPSVTFLGGTNSFSGGVDLVGVSNKEQIVVLDSNGAINAGQIVTAITNGANTLAFSGNINAAAFTVNAAGLMTIGNYGGDNTFAGTFNATASTAIALYSGVLNLTANNAINYNSGNNLSTGNYITPPGQLESTIGTLELSGSDPGLSGSISFVAGGFELGGAAGAITNVTGLTFTAANLTIDNTSGSPVGGRLKSNATVSLTDANFTDLGYGSGATTQTTSGTLTLGASLNAGTSVTGGFINWKMTPGSGGNSLTFGTLTRSGDATVVITASSLGAASGGDNIYGNTSWSSTTNQVGGAGAASTSSVSIIPYMVVVDSNDTGLTAGTFATYGANGLRGLTTSEYNTNFSGITPGGGATINERVNSSATLSASVSGNSLLMDVFGANGGSLALGGNTLTLGNLNSANHGEAAILATGPANFISGGTLALKGTGLTSTTNELIVTTIGNLNIGAQIINTGSQVVSITKGGNGILTLSNTANSYTGASLVNQGILNITANGALGGSTTTVDASSTLEFTGGVSYTNTGSTINFGDSDTLGLGYNASGTPVDYSTVISEGNLGMLYGDANSNAYAGAVNITSGSGAAGIGVATGGTLTLSNFASTTLGSGLGFRKVGGGTLDISNAAYVLSTSGRLQIEVDQGTLALVGANGALAYTNATNTGSDTIAVNPDSTLLLDNTLANNNARLQGTNVADLTTVNLYKGTFQINGNATTNTSQPVATLVFSGGQNLINAVAGASASTTLTITTLTNSSGGIIEGSNLGQALGGGVSNIFAGASGPTLVGGTTSGTNIKIATNLIGDTNDASVGNTFLTYNTTTGFVPLSLSTNYYLASGGANTIAAGSTASTTNNVYVTASDASVTTAKTINSLNINSSSVSTIGGTAFNANVLTVTSGMVLSSGSGNTILNQYAGETSTSATNDYWVTSGSLTMANASSTGTTSVTINKFGAGTLIMNDNASKVVATNVYNGLLLAQTGGNGTLGASSPTGTAISNINVYGGGIVGGNATIYSSITTLSIGSDVTTGNSTQSMDYFYAGAIAPGTPSNSNPYTPGANGTGTAATLTVQNNVYMAPGTFLDYVLNTPTGATAGNGGTNGNSFLKITGQNGSGGILETGPAETLVVTNKGGFGAGVYQLISYGTLDDETQNFRAWNVVGPSNLNYTYSFSTTTTANTLDLIVGVAPSISLTASALPTMANEPQITNGATGTVGAPVGAYAPNTPSNTLTVTYASTGYTPGYIHALNSGGTGISTGYTQTSGFATATETEIFLLKLDVNGTVANPTDDGTIVADINANSPQTGLTASVPTGTFATLGGTAWSIELSFADPGFTNGNLGFNFTGYVDGTISDVTATDVAAVPEPASAGLMALGAAGILGIRRRTRKPRA